MKRNLKFFIFILMSLFCLVNIPRVMAQYTSSNKVCTKVGDTEEKTPCQGRGDFVFYCQGGSPWKDICNLGETGCGPTSVAMIMSTFGVIQTPDQVDKNFRDGSWRSCGSGSDAVGATGGQWFKDLGFTRGPDLTSGPNPDDDRVLDVDAARQAIEADFLILASSHHFKPCANCKAGTTEVDHIFVIDGVDQSGTLSVRDPNNCDYAPGNGLERQTGRSFQANSLRWYYAYPIKKL